MAKQTTIIYNKLPPTVVGFKDEKTSRYVKAWVMAGEVCVVGLIAEGTSRELQSNWDSPFEGANADGTDYSAAAALAQTHLDVTTVTTFNSQQVWKGQQPHSYPLVIELVAMKDAREEVTKAIIALEKMASANLNERAPGELSESEGETFKFGSPPGSVMLNIGTNVLYDKCKLESVSVPLSGPVDIGGHMLHATVTLSIQSDTALNERDIESTFG